MTISDFLTNWEVPISRSLNFKSSHNEINSTNDDHLYMQVAVGLEKMIADDVLKIGDKLPSVRVLSEEYGISMGTAFQAYYHLEGKGLIESRPKSGYYVRFNHRRFPECQITTAGTYFA